jgi:hypothetical protein
MKANDGVLEKFLPNEMTLTAERSLQTRLKLYSTD